MTRAAAAALLTGAIIIAYYESRTPETVTEYRVEVHERTVYTDLDELRHEFQQTAEQLRVECLNIIERQTGDPMQGIINLVDRHYQGDACRAADEALRGDW